MLVAIIASATTLGSATMQLGGQLEQQRIARKADVMKSYATACNANAEVAHTMWRQMHWVTAKLDPSLMKVLLSEFLKEDEAFVRSTVEAYAAASTQRDIARATFRLDIDPFRNANVEAFDRKAYLEDPAKLAVDGPRLAENYKKNYYNMAQNCREDVAKMARNLDYGF